MTPTHPTQASVGEVRHTPVLGPKHTGMRVDYSWLFKHSRSALTYGAKEPTLAEILRQLQGHLKELGERWYAGDTAVVDEILQLYCVECDARAAIARATSLPNEANHE